MPEPQGVRGQPLPLLPQVGSSFSLLKTLSSWEERTDPMTYLSIVLDSSTDLLSLILTNMHDCNDNLPLAKVKGKKLELKKEK